MTAKRTLSWLEPRNDEFEDAEGNPVEPQCTEEESSTTFLYVSHIDAWIPEGEYHRLPLRRSRLIRPQQRPLAAHLPTHRQPRKRYRPPPQRLTGQVTSFTVRRSMELHPIASDQAGGRESRRGAEDARRNSPASSKSSISSISMLRSSGINSGAVRDVISFSLRRNASECESRKSPRWDSTPRVNLVVLEGASSLTDHVSYRSPVRRTL